MAIFVSDSFTDTSGTALASHTGETGASWTLHPTIVNGRICISDANRARHLDAEGGTALYYASGVPASADYDVEATIRQVSDEGTVGVTGRMSTSANTSYRLAYAASTNNWHLSKLVSGVNTTLGTWTESLSNGDERTIKLEMRGSAIKGYVAGVLRIDPGADSAISAAGRAGLRTFEPTTNTTGLHIDNFSATDAGGGGTTVTVTGYEVPVVIGTPTSDTTVTVGVTGLGVAVAIGDPTADTTVTVPVDGLAIPVAFGTVTVVQDNVPQTVAVDGLEIPIQFGSVTALVDQAVPVTGLEVPIQFGTVTAIADQTVAVTGLEIEISFGTVSALSFGWTPVAGNDVEWTTAAAAGGTRT